MNLTEDFTFKKIQRDKPVKALGESYDKLCKQHTKLDQKLQQTFKELKDVKSKSEAQERELSKKQKTIERLIEEKCDLNENITQNKATIRKLESKIAIGVKGSSDISATKQIQILTLEKNALESELNCAYSKLEELEDHIAVISRALELKASELKADVVSMLSIAESKEQHSKLKERERILEAQLEETRASLEIALAELDEVKNSTEKYLTESLDFNKKIQKLESEKKIIEQV